MKSAILCAAIAALGCMTSCSNDKIEEKGFSVNSAQAAGRSEDSKSEGINKDSLKFETRPSNVLLTGIPNVRLTTIYKVNLNKRERTTFIGSNNYLYSTAEPAQGNNWNGNLIPGLEGVYGYNLVNISHFNIQDKKKTAFFDKPVLIKTLYYPSFTKDTLNKKVVTRDYFLVSVYDEDTNKDGLVNTKDLRRFYLFNDNGVKQQQLVPAAYSVFKSEYDSENDLMFVFARFDKNTNGQTDDGEPVNIFWVDLKDPTKTGLQY
jgi:hypothetical protein